MAQTLNAINYNLPGAYQGQQLDAEHAYQQALTNIAQRQASVAHEAGFSYQQNDDGNVSNVEIDPNNQYSQVMNLLSNHAGNMTTLRNSLAGRGLGGTKGLAGKRAALLKFVQTGETSNLGSKFSDALGNLFNERSSALTTRNAAFTNAEQAGLLYATQQQQFNAAQAQNASQADAYQKSIKELQDALGDRTGPYQGFASDVGPNGPATPGYGELGSQIYGDPGRPSWTGADGQTVAPITYDSVGATPRAIAPGIVQPPKAIFDPIAAQAAKVGFKQTTVTPQQKLVNTVKATAMFGSGGRPLY